VKHRYRESCSHGGSLVSARLAVSLRRHQPPDRSFKRPNGDVTRRFYGRHRQLDEDTVKSILVTERVNGWWVSVRHQSGHEEHHGPYPDQKSAEAEAGLLAGEEPRPAEGESDLNR
jgi:hypothetical protein